MRSEHPKAETPWRHALVPAASGIMFLFVTTPLIAQRPPQPWTIQGFAAWREPSSSVLFGGIGVTRYWGVLGLRVGGALHLVPGDGGNTQGPAPLQCGRFGCRNFGDGQDPFNINLGAWMADADLIFEPLRTVAPLRALLLGFSPYAFAGIGGYGARLNASADTSVATLSWGVGARHDLIGPLGVQAEARYRSPLQNESGLTAGWRQNLEYSVGLRVSFGAHSHAQTVTASPPAAPPRSAPPPPEAPGWDESAARFASRVLDIAEGYLNTPYQQGGASPYGGFDAAGFVQYVFGRVGVRLPRTAHEIAQRGQVVSLRIGSLQPGDLLFFASDGSHIDHVGIYAGHERVIHATASGGGVRYDVLGEGERGRWFSDHLVSARRLAAARAPASEARPDESLDPPDTAPAAPR